MIKCDFEQLLKQTDRDLRVWMGREEYQTLVRIVEGKVKQHECKALAEALQGNSMNLKSEAAEAEMIKARMYQNCLDVLAEIRKQPITEVFTIAKLC